jgi:hypothetical protein
MFCSGKCRGRVRRSFDHAMKVKTGTHGTLEERCLRKEVIKGSIISKWIELVTQLAIFISAKNIEVVACASFKMHHRQVDDSKSEHCVSVNLLNSNQLLFSRRTMRQAISLGTILRFVNFENDCEQGCQRETSQIDRESNIVMCSRSAEQRFKVL